MTKEDALFFLGRFRTEGINEKLYDALGVAIEALNAQTDKRTETHTCDLISRQAAIEVIDVVFPVDPMKSEYAQGVACGAALAKTYVEQLPSAQPALTYQTCSDALLKMWMDNVLTDGEYNRIMDKLNAWKGNADADHN